MRVPLASGLLTGKMNSQSSFQKMIIEIIILMEILLMLEKRFPVLIFLKDWKHVEELKKIKPEGFSLTDLSLKWILSHPEVTVVIPGAKNTNSS